MAYSITYAGQDITAYVDQMSIEVTDTLAQGAGTGGGNTPSGRATTFKMNTSLGPVSQAKGAGQSITVPSLVRQGEMIIRDVSNTIIFGGFATKFTDTSNKSRYFTGIEGVDYSTSLSRYIVNETFSALTDIQMIKFLMQKYAPWVNLSLLTTSGLNMYSVKIFRQVTLEQALQNITATTGYILFVDYQKRLHYTAPNSVSTAPFTLSTAPNFTTSFNYRVEEYLVDDNAAINRVTFFGGRKPSGNISQDVSPLANGNNTVFVYAYYPRNTSDGKLHITVNGAQQVIGSVNGKGAANQLKGKGGTADVIVNNDARSATFAYPPPSGATVLLMYQYEYPLAIQIVDRTSTAFYGLFLDGVISDQTVFDTGTAVARCKVILTQQSFGLTTLKLITWKPGLQAGQLLQVFHSVRQLNTTFLIQEVQTHALGGGNFQYSVSCGAWNWNLIDVIMKLSTLVTPPQLTTSDQSTNIAINQGITSVSQAFAFSKTIKTYGGYYSRTTPGGDGHDAYAGLSSISS